MMTKNEFLKELKKHIAALPSEEQDRIVEYYEELIADKMESGESEKQILRGFGSPSEAAGKILTQYGMGMAEPSEQRAAPPDSSGAKTAAVDENGKVAVPDFWQGRAGKSGASKAETTAAACGSGGKRVQSAAKRGEVKEKKSPVKTAVLAAEIIVFGLVFIGLLAVLWALVASVLAVGYSLTAGAIYAAICGMMPSVAAGTRIVEFAIALFAVGLALLIIPHTVKIIKGGAKASGGVYKLFFGWYRA